MTIEQMSVAEVIDSLVNHLEGTANWRREKADEYPDDVRNIEAAEILDRLASQLRSLDGKTATAFAVAVNTTDHFRVSEAFSEYLGRIGFDHDPRNAVELLDDIMHALDRDGAMRELLRRESPTAFLQ
jgi:hypothetical protein